MPDIEEREISKEERDKASASDFAGKNRSFPILAPEDVAAAAASIGRAGSDNYSTDELKRRIIAIAKRKGAAYVAKLPAAWKESYVEDAIETEMVPLVERAVRNDNTIDLKLIAPGWGSSGYYSADVLREDGPQAWPAGTHMYLDHPTESESKERPERSVRDLAAVTVSTPEFREDGLHGPGLYAKASVLPQYREVIDSLAPYIGVSIRAHGAFNEGEVEGRKGRIVTKIAKGESVDFVTKPGAGGKVLALMESLRQKGASDVVSSEAMTSATTSNDYVQTVTTGTYVPETTTTTVSGTYTISPHSVSEVQDQEDVNMELIEAQEQITALQTELEESKNTAQDALVRAERAEGALAILEAQGEARKLMENVSLPAAAKARIVTKVTADPKLNEDGTIDTDALQEAVASESKAEAEYIESIVGAGKVTDQGTATGESKDDSEVKQRLGGGLSKFFGLSEDAAKRAVDGR